MKTLSRTIRFAFFTLAALFGGVLVAVSCSGSSEDDGPARPTLSTDAPEVITFLADGTGGRAQIAVTTNQSGWSCTLNPADGYGWLTVAKSANALQLVAQPNTNTYARKDVTIKISAGEATPLVITVKQPGAQRTGPAGYEFYIYTEKQLTDFRDAVNASTDANPVGIGIAPDARVAKVYQINDLDFAGQPAWTKCIANETEITAFSGTYNGGGKSITGLKINDVGLFGRLVFARVIDVHLNGITISSTSHAGALTGFANSGTVIDRCSASGTVITTASSAFAGGLLGWTDDTRVSRSRTTCAVTGADVKGSLAGSCGSGSQFVMCSGDAQGTAIPLVANPFSIPIYFCSCTGPQITPGNINAQIVGCYVNGNPKVAANVIGGPLGNGQYIYTSIWNRNTHNIVSSLFMDDAPGKVWVDWTNYKINWEYEGVEIN